MSTEEQEVHIGLWFHSSLNPEYYPELSRMVHESSDLELRRSNNRVSNQYADVAAKLEAARYHAHMVIERISHGRLKLPEMLADLRADVGASPESLAMAHSSAYVLVDFRDHVLIAHLEALIVAAKSMLDSLTQFYSIAFNRTVKTFSGSGTNVIADLRNLGNQHDAARRSLLSLLFDAKSAWTDEVIEYRDEITHFGQLREFRCLHVTLADSMTCRPDQVLNSVMPSRRPTSAYVETLIAVMHKFAAEWMRPCFVECKKKEELSKNANV
jgi:hypothetical protein